MNLKITIVKRINQRSLSPLVLRKLTMAALFFASLLPNMAYATGGPNISPLGQAILNSPVAKGLSKLNRSMGDAKERREQKRRQRVVNSIIAEYRKSGQILIANKPGSEAKELYYPVEDPSEGTITLAWYLLDDNLSNINKISVLNGSERAILSYAFDRRRLSTIDEKSFEKLIQSTKTDHLSAWVLNTNMDGIEVILDSERRDLIPVLYRTIETGNKEHANDYLTLLFYKSKQDASLIDLFYQLGGSVCNLRKVETLYGLRADEHYGCADGMSNVFHVELAGSIAFGHYFKINGFDGENGRPFYKNILSVFSRILINENQLAREMLKQKDAESNTPAQKLRLGIHSIEKEYPASIQDLEAIYKLLSEQDGNELPRKTSQTNDDLIDF